MLTAALRLYVLLSVSASLTAIAQTTPRQLHNEHEHGENVYSKVAGSVAVRKLDIPPPSHDLVPLPSATGPLRTPDGHLRLYTREHEDEDARMLVEDLMTGDVFLIDFEGADQGAENAGFKDDRTLVFDVTNTDGGGIHYMVDMQKMALVAAYAFTVK